MKIKSILFATLLTISTYAKSNNAEFFASGGVVANSFEPSSGATYSDANLWVGSIGVRFFPNTWDLSVSYGGTIQTKLLRQDYYDDYTAESLAYEDDMDDSEFIKIFIKPIWSNAGNFGFGYNKVSFVTEIYDEKHQGLHILDFEENDPSKTNSELILHSGVTQHDRMNIAIESNEFYTVYTLPRSSYGVKVAYEEGNKPIFVGKQYLAVRSNYDGINGSFGIFKSDQELINGFNLKTLSFSYGLHNYDFFNYLTNKDDSGTRSQIGFEIDGGYKADIFYLHGFLILKNEGSDITTINSGDTTVKYLHMGLSLQVTFAAY